MMKPALYTSGRMLAEVRITHRIDSLDIINALCLRYKYEDDEPLPDLSATAIEKILRSVLREKPDDRNWWQDELEQDRCDELTKWAEELVRRRFPAFYPSAD